MDSLQRNKADFIFAVDEKNGAHDVLSFSVDQRGWIGDVFVVKSGGGLFDESNTAALIKTR